MKSIKSFTQFIKEGKPTAPYERYWITYNGDVLPVGDLNAHSEIFIEYAMQYHPNIEEQYPDIWMMNGIHQIEIALELGWIHLHNSMGQLLITANEPMKDAVKALSNFIDEYNFSMFGVLKSEDDMVGDIPVIHSKREVISQLI